METIKLKISKKFYDAFLTLIEKCDSKDLQIVNDEEHPDITYLNQQLHELETDTAEYITMEDLDDSLEKALAKHAR
ncbi:hypothetical protein ES711_09085 [Gelidibacter salicanalis]|uniref:Uncharacterized protein n=1 Tax=Gelidibacter salicanalis TaxID=291193 RepID=A0A5C7AS10_9FLAO|nr:hypothetical protein [Gelidibacter salicanalis]TXE08642.1 hypothetical protein ES711_09085 [Gelidibacter salicanalis]